MKLPARKQSEKEIQRDCLEYLQIMGWCVLRLNSGMIPMSDAKGKNRMIRLAPPGTPDLMAFKKYTQVMRGGVTYFNEAESCELIFIECKVPKNEPTIYQNEMMVRLESFGAKCFLIHSLDELEELIK